MSRDQRTYKEYLRQLKEQARAEEGIRVGHAPVRLDSLFRHLLTQLCQAASSSAFDTDYSADAISKTVQVRIFLSCRSFVSPCSDGVIAL
jgi:hypothetical protein